MDWRETLSCDLAKQTFDTKRMRIATQYLGRYGRALAEIGAERRLHLHQTVALVLRKVQPLLLNGSLL